MHRLRIVRQAMIRCAACLALFIGCAGQLEAQVILRGKVLDEETAEPLIGANIFLPETREGTVTDFNGGFLLKTSAAYPLQVVFSYVGYVPDTVYVDADDYIHVALSGHVALAEALVVGDRMTDRQKESPVRINAMDQIDLLQNPGPDISAGLALQPEIDLTTASLGFRIINTRGFNSTSPVRMLQLIDGMDNQSPGLNFSLGNFLGSSELDLARVEVIVGPSAPLHGPNAFNGVIRMESLDPFLHTGLKVSAKAGERAFGELAVRYAASFNDRSGHARYAFKVNAAYLQARDWQADNLEPVTDSKAPRDNPGNYDAVNVYGDEYMERGDYTLIQGNMVLFAGLGTVHRNGYSETDLVDYDTRNLKAGAAFHWRLDPAKELFSPEMIASTAFSTGTTVYQGDNRFSLRDIRFFQHRLEFRRRDRWLIRSYLTHEDAGRSYDPYFTALRLQERSATFSAWINAYEARWRSRIIPLMRANGYPYPDPDTGDDTASTAWLATWADSLRAWHAATRSHVNGRFGFYVPGTYRFDSLFAVISGTLNNADGGTAFYDRSALWHTQAEHVFRPQGWPDIRVGASYRLYMPDSKGTIFSDTSGTKIRTHAWGAFTGIEERLLPDDQLTAMLTLRLDKNEDLAPVHTAAAGVVWNPRRETYLRLSFSSGLRNPTMADQFLWLNVGPAILAGHVGPVDSLITTASFDAASATLDWRKLEYFTIDPIRPEQVRTCEIGIRTRIWDRLDVDAGYYHNWYRDFLGYLIGLTADIAVNDPPPVFPKNVQVFRYSANSQTRVRTQGASLALTGRLSARLTLGGNISWNTLVKHDEHDPIIPAYNTPPWKYNAQVAGHDMPVFRGAWTAKAGFLVNYRYVTGFRFEGSPQFQGDVPAYWLLDAQVHVAFDRKPHLMVKAGATNLLDRRHIEAYGGPLIGRLVFVQLVASF